MIILHNNKNKIYLTFFLSALVFIGLLIAWGKFGISSQASSKTKSEVSVQSGEASSLLKDIQNTVELGQIQWNEVQEKIAKTQKQQELLAAAREYLNNKASTTPTSTIVSTSTATTSIK
jgi:hypothetical protein